MTIFSSYLLELLNQIDTPNSNQVKYAIFHTENTKVREVFDASFKVKGNPNLNECLYKEPQITPLLFDILLWIRCYAIVFTTDSEKEFSRIAIIEPDKEFLGFLLFEDVSWT